MRGVLVAEEDDFQSFYIDNIFNSVWKDGINMNDQNIIDKVIKNLDINPKTFLLRSTSQNIKDKLKKKTNEAFEKGIFGAKGHESLRVCFCKRKDVKQLKT